MMNITREAIQNRLDRLVEEYEQAKANMHAYEGAIQECRYWLNELDIEDKQEESEGE